MIYTFKYRNYIVEVSTDKGNWYIKYTDEDGLINLFIVSYPHTIEPLQKGEVHIIRVTYQYQLTRPGGQKLQQQERSYIERSFDAYYDAILPGGLSYGGFAAIHSINGTLARLPELGGNEQATGYRCFNPDGSFYQPVVFDVINKKDETMLDDGTGTETYTGQKDAGFEVSVINGTPGYEYSLDGATYQAGAIFSGLAAGEYTVYVRDLAGVVRYEPVIISQKYPANAMI